MIHFKSVDEILDFAIEKEEESANFYTELAGKMQKPSMTKVFQDFASEEWGHKAKIQDIKKGKTLQPSKESILNLKIADYIEDVSSTETDFDYQKALILAMKREKASFKLYSDLAGMTEELRIKNVFIALAQEEAKHKLFFEIEYDETFLVEN